MTPKTKTPGQMKETRYLNNLPLVVWFHLHQDEEMQHLTIDDVTLNGTTIMDVIDSSLLQDIYNDLYHRHVNQEL